MVHRHTDEMVQGAAGVVHWATMRGNYSGMPLRLRMVFSENPL